MDDVQVYDNDSRPFPIQRDNSTRNERGVMVYHPSCTIPWWLAEEAYLEYSKQFGASQSLERIAERGGFGRKELLMLLRKEKFHV